MAHCEPNGGKNGVSESEGGKGIMWKRLERMQRAERDGNWRMAEKKVFEKREED